MEGVGPLHPPRTTDIKPHTVKPAAPDDQYPLGAEATGQVTAIGLCAARVTQPIPPGADPYTGDPGQSMRVDCDESRKTNVIAAFKAVGFNVD